MITKVPLDSNTPTKLRAGSERQSCKSAEPALKGQSPEEDARFLYWSVIEDKNGWYIDEGNGFCDAEAAKSGQRAGTRSSMGPTSRSQS